MMRMMLAVLSGALCAAAGLRRAACLQENEARLLRWEQVLRHLTLVLGQGAYSLPQALRCCAQEQQAPDLLLQSLASAMEAQPLADLPALLETRLPPWPESPALRRLASRLCRGSLDSRVQAAEDALQEIRLLARSVRESAPRDAKMWRTLGLLGGACITLMLL